MLLQSDGGWVKQNIIECDAGQKSIDDEKINQQKLIKDKIKEIKNEYEPYSKIRRNEKCSCGSGKKYKQCHLLYFRQYLNV